MAKAARRAGAGAAAQSAMRREAIRDAGRAARGTRTAARTASAAVRSIGRASGTVIKAAVTAAQAPFAIAAGGVVVFLIVVVTCLAGALAESSLGIFFSGGSGGTPQAATPSEAAAQINGELADQLAQLQDGGTYDRVELLREVFWDMTKITAAAETADIPASSGTPASTEEVLVITITARTPDDMRVFYSFTEEQNEAMDELLANEELLTGLVQNLNVTSREARGLLLSLPADLHPERRAVVETACRLVGKVNYFWGGKCRALGWNDAWGTVRKITAAGGSTTGTYRPYGLDCSGFVDWIFYNVSGGTYVIGHGGGAAAQQPTVPPSPGRRLRQAIWYFTQRTPMWASWAAGTRTETCWSFIAPAILTMWSSQGQMALRRRPGQSIMSCRAIQEQENGSFSHPSLLLNFS